MRKPIWVNRIIAEGLSKNKADLNEYIRDITMWLMIVLEALMNDYNDKGGFQS